MSTKCVRIGTRGSDLALAQARKIARQAARAYADIAFEIVVIPTAADRATDTPIAQMGGKGAFTHELDQALLNGAIDAAVHSLKDLPYAQNPDLFIACISEREDPRDALVANAPLDWRNPDLQPPLLLGTSSLRRQALLRAINPSLRFLPLRGNVPTRIQKVQQGDISAAVLAMAGIKRLGLRPPWVQPLDISEVLPAPGQGAIAVQIRIRDIWIAKHVFIPLAHTLSYRCYEMERDCVRALGASCHSPVACYAKADPDGLAIHIEALVASIDGQRILRDSRTCPIQDDAPKQTALALAHSLLERGAAELLAKPHRQE